jgi:hypothetical protein
MEYNKDVKVLKESLIQLEYDLHTKSDQLEKEKAYIYEYEKNSQNKLF